jgi:flavodoxin
LVYAAKEDRKMKKTFLAFLTLTSLGILANAQSLKTQSERKILIAYFSWSGNTKVVAQQIASELRSGETGGTLFEIKTVESYNASYKELGKGIAKKEHDENARPALATRFDDMALYNTVFIGYPIWFGDMPMAVFTFLESYDFSGKTIIPFCTNGGSKFGSSLESLKKECPKSTILEGYEWHPNIFGMLPRFVFSKPKQGKPTIEAPVSGVTKWLTKLGFAQKAGMIK